MLEALPAGFSDKLLGGSYPAPLQVARLTVAQILGRVIGLGVGTGAIWAFDRSGVVYRRLP
jgi:hypothetical protein